MRLKGQAVRRLALLAAMASVCTGWVLIGCSKQEAMPPGYYSGPMRPKTQVQAGGRAPGGAVPQRDTGSGQR